MPVPIIQHNFFSSMKTYIFNYISISFYIIILITLIKLKKQKIYKIVKIIDIIILISYILISFFEAYRLTQIVCNSKICLCDMFMLIPWSILIVVSIVQIIITIIIGLKNRRK